MEKKRNKTEAELIATVANIFDAEACLRFAQRATREGKPALAAACEERAATLKPTKVHRERKTSEPLGKAAKTPMKTHVAAEQALSILIEEYNAGLPPTTYNKLAQLCGLDGGQWFGQVTDLIDAACALADVPSFALFRVREANGQINHAAWRKGNFSHLRDRIVAKARAGSWTDEDFTKIKDALSVFNAQAFGNKKAWSFVEDKINIEAWAGSLN